MTALEEKDMKVRVIPEREEESIYPIGLIRISTAGRHMKISCSFGFSIAVNTESICDRSGEEETEERLAYKELIGRFYVQNGEYRIIASEKMVKLMQEIKRLTDSEDHLMEHLRVRELLIMLSRHDEERVQKLPVSEDCSPNQARVARSAYSYMMKHMDERVTISDLAEKFAISRTQIKESFSKYYGEAIFGFMRREKLLVAAELLERTDQPIGMISKRCGYSNASKFSKAFGLVVGVTPGKYRCRAARRTDTRKSDLERGYEK